MEYVNIIRAITKSNIQVLSKNNVDFKIIEHCSSFIINEINKMQLFYRLGMFFLTLFFNFSFLRSFIKMSEKSRIKKLNNWKKSFIPPFRLFYLFYFNMTILSVYDNKEVLENMGIDYKKNIDIMAFYNLSSLSR